MKAKVTVKYKGASFEIGWAVGIATGIYASNGAACVVTSINDSKHGDGSLHYKGYAADLRTRDLNMGQKATIFKLLQSALEPCGFDVINETDHIHVEYQPKDGESFVRLVP